MFCFKIINQMFLYENHKKKGNLIFLKADVQIREDVKSSPPSHLLKVHSMHIIALNKRKLFLLTKWEFKLFLKGAIIITFIFSKVYFSLYQIFLKYKIYEMASHRVKWPWKGVD